MNLKKRIAALLLLTTMLVMIPCTVYAEQVQTAKEGCGEIPLKLGLACEIELQIPENSAETFVHETKVHPTPVTEVFSLQVGERVIPLCRVDFGNEGMGEWLGAICSGEEYIPVTFTMYPLANEEIAELDGETAASYHETMEIINSVLDGICSDPRFVEAKPGDMNEKRDLSLRYWTIALSEEITCEETWENGVYRAVFYGRIRDGKVALYQVSIGDSTDDSMGVYRMDGQDRPLNVEIFESDTNVFWSQADCEKVYQMMDTVNDVMECIMADKHFRE